MDVHINCFILLGFTASCCWPYTVWLCVHVLVQLQSTYCYTSTRKRDREMMEAVTVLYKRSLHTLSKRINTEECSVFSVWRLSVGVTTVNRQKGNKKANDAHGEIMEVLNIVSAETLTVAQPKAKQKKSCNFAYIWAFLHCGVLENCK